MISIDLKMFFYWNIDSEEDQGMIYHIYCLNGVQ